MAPPELGSQSEDSQPEPSPLEYIEKSLRTLQQNTLKIKKRNDEIIKTIRGPNPISSSTPRGWKGSPIDVPSPPPSTKLSQSSSQKRTPSRAMLNVDVEKILAESSKLKEKINETFRQSEKTREENQKYLENLRKESLQLQMESLAPKTSSGKVGLASSHSMGHHVGIFSSIKTAFKKLGGDSDTVLKAKEQVEHLHLLAPVSEAKSGTQNVPIQLYPLSLEETDSQPNLPPPIKPRVKRPPPPPPPQTLSAIEPFTAQNLVPDPRPCPRIRRPQMPPPPQPPAAVLQLEDFKKMYENQPSDEETTLNRPIPKPRATLQSSQSYESSSESEFEYISAPLLILTMPAVDSDESFASIPEATIPTNELEIDKPVKPARFQKNSQSTIPVPKHYMKSKVGEERQAPQPSLQKNPRQKIRAASPPPPSSLQMSSRKVSSGESETLSYLSEEDPGTAPESSTENLTMVNLQNCPSDKEKVDLSQPETTSRTSALQLGVTVEPIEIPIRPWVEQESATNRIISASPFHCPETESNCTVTEEKVSHSINEHELDMDQKIEKEFSFLDEINENANSVFPENIVDSGNTIEKTCLYFHMADEVTESTVDIAADIPSPLRIYPKIETVEEFSVLEESLDSNNQVTASITTPDLSPILPTRVDHPIDSLPFIPSPPPVAPPPPPPMQQPSTLEGGTSFSSLPVLPLDEKRFKRSVFHTIHALKPIHLQLDQNFIQENFMRIESPENENRRLSLACRQNQLEASNADPINLLSLKLKQAIEIGSRNIKQKENSIIIDAVRTINSENMDTDDVQVLLQMIPKENEGDTFAKLDDKQCSKLPEGYKIMKCLVKIPRLNKKLNAINFLLNFPDSIKCIKARMETLQNAVKSVKDSENFVKILQVVLAVVNQFGKEIKGFQIQSLERLARKKSSKSGVPLLNYIVKQVSENMPKDTVHFYEDFQCIEEASKISLTEANKVFKELENEICSIQMEILATGQDFVEEEIEIRSSLEKAQSNIENIRVELQEISEIWINTVRSLKELAEFFGMFNTQEDELLDFFHTIQHFVTDFKQALMANERMFWTVSEPQVCSSTGVNMRKKSLPPSSNESGGEDMDKKMRRRQSLGPTTCQMMQHLGEESGQPQDFVNAITEFVTPRSPPKNQEEVTDGKNRQRKKIRKSQNFGKIEIQRERERQ